MSDLALALEVLLSFPRDDDQADQRFIRLNEEFIRSRFDSCNRGDLGKFPASAVRINAPDKFNTFKGVATVSASD